MSSIVDVLIGIGSNIEPMRNVAKAVERLGADFDLCGVSTIYTSAPVGRIDQPVFFNGAAHIRTDQPVDVLKRNLLTIESDLGRIRDPNDKCGPRTIDLDIISYGDCVSPDHQIPDPGLDTRWFVAIPAAELLPDWVHPITGRLLIKIAEDHRDSIDGEPVDVLNCYRPSAP